jgi:hypothetical protein
MPRSSGVADEAPELEVLPGPKWPLTGAGLLSAAGTDS